MGGCVIILLFSKVVKSLVYLCNENIYIQGKKNTKVQKEIKTGQRPQFNQPPTMSKIIRQNIP